MNKEKTPAQLIPASTIIPVRDSEQGLEIYLLKRNEKSRFMGGLYVFPGGMVDAEDKTADAWNSHIDVDRSYIEEKLGKNGYSFEETLGFSIAAIRETLEEAGVFLASGQGKCRKDFEAIAAYRLEVDPRTPWFRQKVLDDGWILSLSSLKMWSHWITPLAMPKRFDTFFFIARMPDGQVCKPDMKETETGLWLTPKSALDKNLQNEIPLSPPTLTTLTQMLSFPDLFSLDKALLDRTWPDAIMPRAVLSSMGPMVLMPWDPDYEDTGKSDMRISDPEFLEPGRPFSRVLNDCGAWKPFKS